MPFSTDLIPLVYSFIVFHTSGYEGLDRKRVGYILESQKMYLSKAYFVSFI